MFETQVTVIGNVATAVKAWSLASGDVVAKFRIASNERWRPPSGGGSWISGDSFFVQVTCWRQLAENVVASLDVGDPVVVHGRIYTDEYEYEGQRRTATRLEAHAIGADLSRCKAALTRVRRGVGPTGPAAGERATGAGGRERDVWSTTDGGRAALAAAGPEPREPEAPSDDQAERLGAPVEAGVGG
jgi:single-strand DNA-binding protein